MIRNWRSTIKIFIIILVCLALLGIPAVLLDKGKPEIQADLVAAPFLAESPSGTAGFARTTGPVSLDFPTDHGPHPEYQTEWWYFTGNLSTPEGRRFGYQLTFFRRALIPIDQTLQRESSWGMSQAYMAHFALTDVSGGSYQAFERLSRGAAGLAGAQSDPFQVWLENWHVEEVRPGTYRLQASQDQVALDMTLVDLKGVILQGDQGYSQKGPEPGNASYYYSLTRLDTEGQVQVGNERFAVTGLSWMDHEYSTSALSAGQVGWDWFSIQLNDGSELMVFQIRREDGRVDPFSSGTFVMPNGSTKTLAQDEITIDVESTWRSPQSGAEYPSRWTIRVPSIDLEIAVRPLLADQELNVSYAYWEGAVQAEGTRQGRSVQGNGYVELTGYARSMTGEF